METPTACFVFRRDGLIISPTPLLRSGSEVSRREESQNLTEDQCARCRARMTDSRGLDGARSGFDCRCARIKGDASCYEIQARGGVPHGERLLQSRHGALRRPSRRLEAILPLPEPRRRGRRGRGRDIQDDPPDTRRDLSGHRGGLEGALARRGGAPGRQGRGPAAHRRRLSEARRVGARLSHARSQVRRSRSPGAAQLSLPRNGRPRRREPDDDRRPTGRRLARHSEVRDRRDPRTLPAALRRRRAPGSNGPDRAASR
jgi:hypothetical protein